MTASRSWVGWIGTALSLLGIVVALWLTIAHFTTPLTLACPDTGPINCAKVTTSSYSTILGVPVALLGLFYFLVMLPLQLPQSWKSTYGRLSTMRLLWSLAGIIMIFWLIYVELFRLNAICLYCSAVHLITLAIFANTMVGTALKRRSEA